MTQLLTLQSRQTWNTFALLSSEKSLEEKIKSSGGIWQAGMSVRFPDVDVTDVNEKLSNETMRSINSIADNYGHAGHKFIDAIFKNGLHHKSSELNQAIRAAARRLAKSEESQLIRAAVSFALIQIAGDLAKEFDILPKEIDPLKTVAWAYKNYLKSSDSSILHPRIQIIENIQSWIATRWDVTIKTLGTLQYDNNREAVGWYDNNTVYIPSSTIVEAAGSIAKKEFISKVFIEKGLLFERANSKQATINYVRGVGGGKFYALDRHKLQLRTTEQDPSQPEAEDD